VDREPAHRAPFIGVTAAVVAVGCCAAVPALAAAAASVGVAVALGLGAGVLLVTGAVAGVLVVVRRRRRSCESTSREKREHGDPDRAA
jgi:hypothetical protein